MERQNEIKDLFSSLHPGCAEIADEVYMEVIVGEEEATSLPDTQLEDSGVNKTFVPVAWAAAYGRSLCFFPENPCHYFLPHPAASISGMTSPCCGVWKQLLISAMQRLLCVGFHGVERKAC